MSDATAVGLIVLCAMAAPFLLCILPLRDYRRLCREWAELAAQVEAARADFEDVRAAERESLIDRIAREELAGFFVEWDAEVGS